MTGSLTSTGRLQLHEAMAARVAAGELPGLVTVLALGDEVHVDTIGAYGFAGDPGAGVPMRRDTLFRIASLTKPVLATVAMMLVDEGLVEVAEPVDRLLPELAGRRVLAHVDGPLTDTVPARRPITVSDLLTFRLGFGTLTEPSFNPPFPIVTTPQEMGLVLGAPDPRTRFTPDEWLARFATLPLMYQPGERWLYNVGSLLLGVLVARAAKAPLAEVMRGRLFDPLGMTDTGFHTTPDGARRIPGYYMTGMATGVMTPQPMSPPDEWTTPPVFPSGSAGLLSTVDDYLSFARLLAGGGVHRGVRLLSSASVAAMTTNQLTDEQIDAAGVLLEPKGWGYGMAVATRADAASAVPGRYGWDGGYGTSWFHDPCRGLTAIAMSQCSDFLFNGGRAEFTALALAAVE